MNLGTVLRQIKGVRGAHSGVATGSSNETRPGAAWPQRVCCVQGRGSGSQRRAATSHKYRPTATPIVSGSCSAVIERYLAELEPANQDFARSYEFLAITSYFIGFSRFYKIHMRSIVRIPSMSSVF
jgi:hypothetical protein